MNKDLNHRKDELDKKLREKYAKYSIQPDESLWDSINSRSLAENKWMNSPTKIKWIRVASIVFAFGFLAFLAYQIVPHYSNHMAKTESGKLSFQKNSSQSLPESDSLPAETDSLVYYAFNQKNSKLNVDSHNKKYHSPQGTKTENEASFSASEITELTTSVVLERQEDQVIFEADVRREPPSFTLSLSKSVSPFPAIVKRRSLHSEKSGIVNDQLMAWDRLENSRQINKGGDEVSVKQLKTMSGKWFAEGFVGPTISYRSIAPNPEFSRLALYDRSYFNAREKAQLSWSYGLNGGYRLSDKIKVKAGLNLSTYSLKFNTEGRFFEEKSASEYILYTSFGEAVISITGVNPIPEETIINSSIALHYMSVPMAIEYQLLKQIAISFGVNFEALRSQELNWESNSQNIDSDERLTQISGVNRKSVSLSLGVLYEQPLLHNTSLLVNPIFLSQIKSPSSSGPYHAYPNSLGIRIGIRRYFGKLEK